jgi:preprotein translocase subunit SecG
MVELVLNVLLVLTSVLLVVLILLHRGKGGGLSSQLSGSSVVEKNLNRLTVFIGLIWTVCIIGLGILLKV